ncbi:MAG: DUF4440 domain-containing protein [Burkholderiaceae bacterium]|jgi:glyoxylase I family protein|nr:DUF4440 domain-containing protein [Burkholderiaceae bacterium]
MNLKAHLLELENRLLQPEVRANAQALMGLIDEDFFEFGASGTVWTRDTVIQALCGEPFAPRCIADFRLTLLADDVALVTYRAHRIATAEQPAADSLRSSIWKRRDDGAWRMQFHQGTPLSRE